MLIAFPVHINKSKLKQCLIEDGSVFSDTDLKAKGDPERK